MRFKRVAILFVLGALVVGAPTLASDQGPQQDGPSLAVVIDWVKEVLNLDEGDGDDGGDEIGGALDPTG